MQESRELQISSVFLQSFEPAFGNNEKKDWLEDAVDLSSPSSKTFKALKLAVVE